MNVTNIIGESFELTKDEDLYFKALKRLEKYAGKQGRLSLFASNGGLRIRINDRSYEDDVGIIMGIRCEAGDGGD